MNTKIGYFFIVAFSHLCATESLPNGTPGTPVILSQYHEEGSAGVESTSGSGSASASGSGSGSASGSGDGPDVPNFFYPFGEDVGDTRLQPIDDGSSEEIPLNMPVVFYGNSEYHSYVSSNGLLSFQEELSDCCPRDFPLLSVPLIAPFWHNINILAGGNVYYRQTADPELITISCQLLQTFNITPPIYAPINLLIVTWERVVPFSDGALSELHNTFQLVITTDGVISSAFFLYGDIQWGEAAQIGFNAGDGISSLSLPGALTEDTVNIEEQSNVGHPGIFAYRIDDLTGDPTTEQPTDPTTAPTTPSPPTTTATVSTDSPPPSPLFAPFGLSVGDQFVPPGDDITEGPFLLQQPFRFFGKNETEVYIGTNGVISFQQNFTQCCEPRDFPRGPPPLIAPFWHDVSTINGGNIFYRQTSDSELLLNFRFYASVFSVTFNPNSILVVTWDQVAPFFDTNEGLSNSFQVWLGSDGRESFVLFLYGDIQWGENAQIGFNAGDNVRSISLSEALTANTVDIEFHSNINITGAFVFQVDDLPCPSGTYRSPEGCPHCPLNTNTSVENVTICQCLPGYFRATFEGPAVPCTQPPSECRDIRAISTKDRSIDISWEIPTNTGRDDFYYIVEYTDGESSESNLVFSQSRVVQYTIAGLKPGTDYTILVTVENGVSDQDAQNEHLRRCELRRTTLEDRPSPPIDVQALCNIVIWGAPLNPNGKVTEFEVEFFIPDADVTIVRHVPKDRTFYIVEEEDKLSDIINILIRVRASTGKGPGEWSAGKSLGCDDSTALLPTCPPCECPTCEIPTVLTPSIYFELDGQVFVNNSVLSLSKVGEEGNALLCKTDLIECCGTVPNRYGQFYYPNGVMVPVKSRAHGFYRDRGDQVVRLNRREQIISPKGTFRCEIPDKNGIMQKLYITLR